MPSKPSKRPAKPTGSVASPPPSSTSAPSPFISAPASLNPFLTTLSPTHIYITHIDTHPRAFKRRIFLVPILLNLALILGLSYRAYTALPTYFSILIATLGYDNADKIPVRDTPWGHLLEIFAFRTGLFMFDYFLATIILPWPVDFFFGRKRGDRTSPVEWRWRCGFRDREVVVRRSRKWDEALKGKDWTRSGEVVERDEEGVVRERIAPAVEGRWIREKTGYLMMDRNWDLDFGGMVRAWEMLEKGDVGMEEFRNMVLVWRGGENGGEGEWVVWRVESEKRGGDLEFNKFIEELRKA